jgi:aminoglycoside phosphotransferase family enzyme/predicted kinase
MVRHVQGQLGRSGADSVEQQPFTKSLVDAGYELVETHISRVFLQGDDVYKTKRPVALGFCDFSTLARREQACLAELQLNRRLTSDVYLDVVALVRQPSGALRFVARNECAADAVLEWAVHMRRLRDQDRADVLLAAGDLQRADLECLAASLAVFHRDARSDQETARFGAPEAILTNVQENFSQTALTVAAYLREEEVAALAVYQLGFLERERERFERRAHGGFVRDGHGDLRLEHCYRTKPGVFAIIDCIEFNDRFRFADVAADLSFLAMDLGHHDRTDLAELFVAAYAQSAGDYGIYALLDFYESYRATVRAKVSSMLAEDPRVARQTREHARNDARRYYLHALAAGHKPLAPPRIYVTLGVIASGKSTLARALSGRLGLPVLSADYTRKELHGVPALEPRHEEAFQGLYSQDSTECVYETMLARSAEVVRSGRSVVLDASFRASADRLRLLELARQLSVEVLYIECYCSRELALERLERRASAESVSDGRAEIYDAFGAKFEPVSELDAGQHLRIDTSQPLEQSLEQVLARVS